ncbi:MAG: hypothetical protein GC189_04510 [Alphaproteobacteria bacterium]|nr:hypothetical protein [Alphaproteobacteria bacterium]
MRRAALIIAALFFSWGLSPARGQTVTEAGLRWEQTPAPADFARFYPQAALERGISGRVVLDCRVVTGAKVACGILEEDPAGFGFGASALRISPRFQVGLEAADGGPVLGRRLRIPISFRVEDAPALAH